MNLLLTLLVLQAAVLRGQSQLVTNYDGSLVLFTAPQMRPVQASPEFSGFILAIENGTFRIYRQHGNPTLGNMDISRDAKVFTWALDAAPRFVTTVEGVPGRGVLETDQAVRLSGNGRFAIRFDHTANAYRWYLDSGRITYLTPNNRGQAARNFGRLIADDGTAVLGINGQVLLFAKDSTDLVWQVLAASGTNPVIDDAATAVVWTLPNRSQWELYDLTRGTVTTRPGRAPMLSSDGRKVLYVGTETAVSNRLMLFDRDRDVPILLNGPADALYTLSGDGRVVWLVNGSGVHRLTIATNTLELMAPFPVLVGAEVNLLPAVPGSLYSVFTYPQTGIEPQVASPPLPETLDSLGVLVNGRPAPIQSISKRRYENRDQEFLEVRIQIPWNVTMGRTASIAMERASPVLRNSGLAPLSGGIPLSEYFPSLFYTLDEQGREFVTAEHVPLLQPVTYASPARPGQTIRLLMTGLGPVRPAVANGVLGTSPAVNSIACHLWTEEDFFTLDVGSATLAGNLVGAYHVTVALPAVVPANRQAWISCDSFPLLLPLAP